MQHMIANREGWARGGSYLQFIRNHIRSEAYALYLKLAGEVEARNAVSRLYLNEQQRQRKSPLRSELELKDPVPRDQQIIHFWP